MTLVVEYCGEEHPLDPEASFTIGRDADLTVDEDNGYLHRRMVQITNVNGFWWITNVGTRLPITVSGEVGSLLSHLGPGASVPVVLPDLTISFGAGGTVYEVDVHADDTPFVHVGDTSGTHQGDGPISDLTMGAVDLTPSQLQLVLALAEPMLRRTGAGPTVVPSNAEAAKRLGISATTFNRKLDAVCDKYARAGVPGLRGDGGKLATARRTRLVEYVVRARIARPEHLELLDDPAPG